VLQSRCSLKRSSSPHVACTTLSISPINHQITLENWKWTEGKKFRISNTDTVTTLEGSCKLANLLADGYLTCDPLMRKQTALRHEPRQSSSAALCSVKRRQLVSPRYVVKQRLFSWAWFSRQHLAQSARDFVKMFSPAIFRGFRRRLRNVVWATGYATHLSTARIYSSSVHSNRQTIRRRSGHFVPWGRYQCRRWEMQAKGAGRTPYAVGADGSCCASFEY